MRVQAGPLPGGSQKRSSAPRRDPAGRTLRLERPGGRTAVLALLIVLLLAGLAELLARQAASRSASSVPILGSGHRNFDLKVMLLDRFVREEGRVDCLFLGPSTVNRGMDPKVFRRVYRQRTGRDIRCFNLGIAGLNMTTAEAMVRILIRRYHPRLIILGALPTTKRQGRWGEQNLLQSPWVKYHLGDFSIDGWLTEHSFAFREYLRFRQWLEVPASVRRAALRDREILEPDGFAKGNRVYRRIGSQPDPMVEADLFRKFSDFELSEDHLASLERVLALKSQVGLVLVEPPVHPSFFGVMPEGQKDYEHIVSETRMRAERAGVVFLPTSDLGLVPESGWYDRHHMNASGAELFTAWLAERVVEATGRARSNGYPR